jgi:hypothetical protein
MHKSIIAVAAVAVTAVANAGPNWTYADIGYLRGSSGSEDTEAYQLRGSIGFANIWHARLEYADGEIAGGAPSGLDVDGYRISVGAHPAINDTTDFVFEIGYVDGDVSAGGPDLGSDGYSVSTGIRTMWTENFELNAGVSAIDLDTDNLGDSTTILVQAGGQYLFTDNVGVGVDVYNGSGTGNLANFYVRWNF